MLHIRAYFNNFCTTWDFVRLDNADKVNVAFRYVARGLYDSWLVLDEGEHLCT